MSVSRLFEIVYVLLELPTVTAGELARRFEVSERTIYRDIECLSQAGIPVYMRKGKGGGIFPLLPGFVLDRPCSPRQRKKIFSLFDASRGGIAADREHLCADETAEFVGEAKARLD